MKILAIETSCDETAAAVIENTDSGISILSNIVASQIEIHKKYGGVFPEIASRAHTEQIIAVIEESLGDLDIKNDIDLIAVTAGPGLIGSLLVGVNAAKTLSFANNKPIMPINHWLGHIYSCFAPEISNDKFQISNQIQNSNLKINDLNKNLKLKIENSANLPSFPLIALIVSGGHTGLVLMKSHTEIVPLGETLDDAAGEAFDKVAKMLELPYPGGPAISAAAEQFQISNFFCHPEASDEGSIMSMCHPEASAEGSIKMINPHVTMMDSSQAQNDKPSRMTSWGNDKIPNIKFPRAMLDRKDSLDFSFSGIKTSVLNKIRELTEKYPLSTIRPQVAYEFQQCVIDILIGKTLQAAEEYKPKSICLCGGVSANKELREQMKIAIKNHNLAHSNLSPITYHLPPLALTGDNAAMIGLAAAYQMANGVKPTTYDKVNADSNLKFN